MDRTKETTEDFDPSMFMETGEEQKKDEQSADEGEQKKDWLIEGKYKTKTDVLRDVSEKEQRIRMLEAQLKQSPVKEDVPKEVQNELDKSMEELGIKEEEIFLKPKESIAKIVKHNIDKAKQDIARGIVAVEGNIKSEILKDKLSSLYPGFVLDKSTETKIVNMIKGKYSTDYVLNNQVKVFSEAIESMGGKRIVEPSIEKGDGGELPLRGKKLEDEENRQIDAIFEANRKSGTGDPIQRLAEMSKNSKGGNK